MATLQSQPSSSLAHAIIASSSAPMLHLDGMVVVAASARFCSMFDVKPQAVQGREFVSPGSGEWTLSQRRVSDCGVSKRTRPD